jgi:hypothetical protein
MPTWKKKEKVFSSSHSLQARWLGSESLVQFPSRPSGMQIRLYTSHKTNPHPSSRHNEFGLRTANTDHGYHGSHEIQLTFNPFGDGFFTSILANRSLLSLHFNANRLIVLDILVMKPDRPSNTSLPLPSQNTRHLSPPPSQLRQRGLHRAATFADGSTPAFMPPSRRRSSVFSEGLSETGKSLLSSTDDLLLPRYKSGSPLVTQHEPSHWHSVPLGLALLPAVGGLFFQNGSAVITDITLLALAAIFLNWTVRLPWYTVPLSVCS